jgi:hypothetical protein
MKILLHINRIHSCNNITKHENVEKNDYIVFKIISTFNIVPQIYYYSNKRILIFIALNRARKFMINGK